MVPLPDVVHVQRLIERELLVAIDVDNRALAKRFIQPHPHGTVGVVSCAMNRCVVLFPAMHEHPHVDLFVSLLHDDLADPALVWAKQDTKLELAYVALTETERLTEALSPAIRAVGLASEDPPDAGPRPV